MNVKCRRGIGAVVLLALILAEVPNVPAWGSEVTPNTAFSRVDSLNTWVGAQPQNAVILKSPSVFVPSDDLDGVEVSHDRYSRTYALEDGSYVTRVSDEPLTYVEDGVEKDIDNTLVVDGEGYRNAANAHTVLLPRENGGVTIENDGVALRIVALFGELGNSVVSENAIRYNSVVEGVDLQYTVLGAALKEDLILNYPVGLSGFSYELDAEGVVFTLESNVVYGFVENQLDPVFVISAPEMFDAAGVVSTGITLTLVDDVMTVVPDAGWLAAPERVFPVVIDPTYTLTNDNLSDGVVQAFAGEASGPNTVHHISYLYVGLEDGSLIGVEQNGVPIVYGQSWSYVKINDITAYTVGLPDNAIVSASLRAWKYAGAASPSRFVDAKMIVDDWGGNGRETWNNRPRGGGLTDLANGQDVSGVAHWVEWDITAAYREWHRDPSTNRGIMLTPRNEGQKAVCFSGTGNRHGGKALYFELHWTVPNAVDEDMALDTPNVELRPLTFKDGYGSQVFTGVFADGVVRPTLQVDYRLNDVDGGSYVSAEYGRVFPDSDVFSGVVPFTLGWYELYESNWQSKLFLPVQIQLNRLHAVYASATNGVESTAEGKSDGFIIYRFQQQDTLPYVANYYGVTRDQIVRDNRTGDDLAMPGNTVFIRNPQKNAEIPYTRPDDLTLEQKRALIYANMGRSQTSEFDIEPVNMNTGNFWFESVDAQNTEYVGNFNLTRTYNSLGEKSVGVFGRGWSFEYLQTLTGRTDGGMTLNDGDGKQLVFPKSGAGWVSPVGYNLALTRVNNADQHLVTYEIRDENGTVRVFDSYGVLRSVTDSRGFTTAVNYDSNYKLAGITTGSGRNYVFTLNADNLVTSVTLPNGGVLRYEYDAQGFMTAFVNADNDRVTYTYNTNAQMV
jgi:YD repeat-containing protein